jgi:uncharacterized protein
MDTLAVSPLPTSGGFVATTRIATPAGSRYLQQLCKHFAHKLPTTFDPTTGRIAFPLGPVRLTADAEGLEMTLDAASDEDRAKLEDVVARHLVRFAFRETLEIVWVRSEAAAV